MAKKSTTYFTGNSANIWVDNEEMISATKGSVKSSFEYEEVPVENGLGKRRILVGEDHDVTLTYKNIGEVNLSEIFDITKDIDVIMSNENVSGAVTKRVKAINVTFDDRTWVDFEKKTVGEIELTGKAEAVEELQ